MAVPAQHDEFHFLTATRAIRLPLPPTMRNHGNLIISLSQLTAWLAQAKLPVSMCFRDLPPQPPYIVSMARSVGCRSVTWG